MEAESLSGDDDEPTPDSDSDSNTPLPPSHLQKKVSRPSWGLGLRRFYLLSQSDISSGLKTRTQKMSWRPWKATVTGRTEEVNELEKRKFSSLSRSDNDTAF